MFKLQTTQIDGTVSDSTLVLEIDKKRFETNIDADGKFEIEIPDELFSHEFEKYELVILLVVIVALVSFCLYELVEYIINFHSTFGLNNSTKPSA